MGIYYDQIMGQSLACFVPTFNRLWESEIASHQMPYCKAAQIQEGNRLRPIIMTWGYYLNNPVMNHEYIASFAICMELIHKASILLDDLIDKDDARHGTLTFHIQYSDEEALLYAIFLLGRGVELMQEKDSFFGFTNTELILKIINSMSKGGLKEVQNRMDYTIETVKEIINLETTSLIKNSFILGYRLSSSKYTEIPEDIHIIGQLCGYCFQVLNDLEPFLAPGINKVYKGKRNCDFEKNRKNIVIAYLFGCCSKQERYKLSNESDYEYIYQLIDKYQIINLLFKEVNSKIVLIKNSIHNLNSQKVNISFYKDFAYFLRYMFSICYKKCGLTFEEDFFDYRKKWTQ